MPRPSPDQTKKYVVRPQSLAQHALDGSRVHPKQIASVSQYHNMHKLCPNLGAVFFEIHITQQNTQ